MATYTGKQHTNEVLAAAKVWQERCLENSLSVLTDKQLWTPENFTGLKHAFVDNPLLGPETFIDKLKTQLSSASPAVIKLAAEALWLLYLFVSRDQFGEKLKRERVQEIWALSGEASPQSQWMNDGPLEGLARPGAAFMTKIPNELEYLVTLLLSWKALDANHRADLLKDPWKMSDWIAGQRGSDSRAFRHMFLYFNFPESFERINSWGHKRTILERFGATPTDGGKLDGTAVDKALLALRRRLEAEHQTQQLDFYLPPLKEVWQKTPDVEVIEEASRVWIEKTIVQGRPDRMGGDHALGKALWSPQRSKANGDIYANMRKVQPGHIVLHLTDNQAISHVSIADGVADGSFHGVDGTEWQNLPAYRIPLRDTQKLDPPLLRAEFLSTEPFASRLRTLISSGAKGLFFNSELTLNQGAYLTEATPELLGILQDSYFAASGKHIPYIEEPRPEGPSHPAIEVDGFSADGIVKELFLENDEIEAILALWKAKKNIILQGPPGVGKSFAAQRLSYLLMATRAKDRIGFVQFHQSYAYEDFVEGYRPSGEGFALRRGRFLEFCNRAASDLSHRYVFIIDEINRGNLSKILGELMLLIEADKRDPSWAVELAYSKESFHVPPNVHIIGLMNTADRSLAVVDYALRRRFAFVDLAPKLDSDKFANQLLSAGLAIQTVSLVRERIAPLNLAIVEDKSNLGAGFAIGHSFFCAPPSGGESDFAWFGRIVRTELVPLLREYWFDAPDKAMYWEDALLADL